MTDLALQRIVLRPITIEIATAVVDGPRQPNWAADYPTDGDVVICSLMLRSVAAGVDFHPATVLTPWSGPWQILTKGSDDSLTVIGAIGFKGLPLEGVVEIGYGIAESARGSGYATEAVMALLQLADSAGVGVIAETEPGNEPSERVLRRCGFEQTHTAQDGNSWWRAQ